jgi:hypothetical protein
VSKPRDKNEVDIGHAIYVKWSESQAILRTSDEAKHIFVNKDDLRALIKLFKEKGIDLNDNDKGKSGKADYLTVDPFKMAEEIVTSDAFRGAVLAQALYRYLGWGQPEVGVGVITYRLPGSIYSDELQPKVPVDTGRDAGGDATTAPEGGSFEDHYPR